MVEHFFRTWYIKDFIVTNIHMQSTCNVLSTFPHYMFYVCGQFLSKSVQILLKVDISYSYFVVVVHCKDLLCAFDYMAIAFNLDLQIVFN